MDRDYGGKWRAVREDLIPKHHLPLGTIVNFVSYNDEEYPTVFCQIEVYNEKKGKVELRSVNVNDFERVIDDE